MKVPVLDLRGTVIGSVVLPDVVGQWPLLICPVIRDGNVIAFNLSALPSEPPQPMPKMSLMDQEGTDWR